jgi:hypothetical protein
MKRTTNSGIMGTTVTITTVAIGDGAVANTNQAVSSATAKHFDELVALLERATGLPQHARTSALESVKSARAEAKNGGTALPYLEKVASIVKSASDSVGSVDKIVSVIGLLTAAIGT